MRRGRRTQAARDVYAKRTPSARRPLHLSSVIGEMRYDGVLSPPALRSSHRPLAWRAHTRMADKGEAYGDGGAGGSLGEGWGLQG